MRLKLAIIDDQGNVTEVLDDLEQYDLEKPAARSEIINDLRITLGALKTDYGRKPNSIEA